MESRNRQALAAVYARSNGRDVPLPDAELPALLELGLVYRRAAGTWALTPAGMDELHSHDPAPQAPSSPGQGTVTSFAELSPEQLYANGIAALDHAVVQTAVSQQAAFAAVAQAFFAATLAKAALEAG